jgi:hypothetical protein
VLEMPPGNGEDGDSATVVGGGKVTNSW